MASSAQLPVATGATPTRLSTGASRLSDGGRLLLTNTGSVDVILGGADVSTANGWRGLVVGATLVLDCLEDLYAVVAGDDAGAVDVMRAK